MDFLDSIDADVYHDKKSNRVRSWYIYEQFKSLERNQLDAAEKLKSKSYQDRILRQEINERRSRRQLYDPSDEACVDEIHRTASECNKLLIANSEDLFESLVDLQDDIEDSAFSQDSWVTKSYSREFCNLDLDEIHDNSCSESVNSVIDNPLNKSTEMFAMAIESKLKSLENNLNKNVIQNVPETKESIENYNIDKEEVSRSQSFYSVDENNAKISVIRHRSLNEITVHSIWSKLVSFSYQVIRLHHGNCYCDYGSQLLTAILACDVLRRGLTKMCDILQPYVTPIKYTEVAEDSTSSYKTTKWKTSLSLKNQIKPKNRRYSHSCKASNKSNFERLRNPESNWQSHSKYGQGGAKYRSSEPCHSVRQLYNTDKNSSGSGRPCSYKHSLCENNCSCSCHAKVANPMLKIVNYIDKVVEELKEC